jgi:hypothetical protein
MKAADFLTMMFCLTKFPAGVIIMLVSITNIINDYILRRNEVKAWKII